MTKKLIVANWKMNPANLKDAEKLFNSVKKKAIKIKEVETVICPPFIYFSKLKGLPLGGQNVFYREEGAFTGEISPVMLKNMGVEYVIIGHSERRKKFEESDEIINKKLKAATEAGLSPIFCVGEDDNEDPIAVLNKQLLEGLKNISRQQVKNIVVAYEPVWAIGTGKNCSPAQALSSILFIRKTFSDLYSRDIADHIRILYGGSVNKENARSYLKESDINGLLVGNASLDPEIFKSIINEAGV